MDKITEPTSSSFTISPSEDGMRLDCWCKQHLSDVPFSLLQKGFRQGWIKLNGKKAAGNTRIEAEQTIWVASKLQSVTPQTKEEKKESIPKHWKEKIKQCILYRDDNIIAINKPQGLAVQGGNKIKVSVDGMRHLLQGDAKEPPRLVHRLDKDTSGVLVLARHRQAANILTRLFRDKEIEKYYWALVIGTMPDATGKISLPLAKLRGKRGEERMVPDKDNGQKSLTEYRIIQHVPHAVSWVELQPHTGRTHQLRVHCSAVDAPILGDGKYGGKQAFLKDASNTLHLHARTINIPYENSHIEITAPLPPHMQESWEWFGFEE